MDKTQEAIVCPRCGFGQPHPRTDSQNRALHTFFRRLASEMNNAGFELKSFFESKELDVPWNGDRVKDLIWRPIQEAMLDKKSTRKLTTEEVSQVYEVVTRKIAEMTGVYVPFPTRGGDGRD